VHTEHEGVFYTAMCSFEEMRKKCEEIVYTVVEGVCDECGDEGN
jgi:hypothetical protein